MIKVLDLFSGIGGFAYASERIVGGFETVAFCEIDPFCQKVLKKNFPEVPIYHDIKELEKNAIRYRGYVDVICGGFPCQVFSNAGKKEGHEDKKGRYLWPEMASIIKQVLPRFVIGENVRGFVNMPMGLQRSVNDLESIGYRVANFIIPSAYALGLPHRRERCWIIAEYVADTNNSTNSTNRKAKREKESLQREYRQTRFPRFFGRASDDTDFMADTNNSRQQQSNKELERRSSKQFDGTSIQSTETVADSESIKSRKQTEWQRGQGFRGRSENIGGSETERKEIDRTAMADTKRMGWKERSKIRETSQREGWADNFSNSSSTVTETEDAANSNSFKQECSTKEQIYGKSNIQTQSSRSSKETQRRLPSFFSMGNVADGISERLGYDYTIEPGDLPRTVKKEQKRADKLKALGNSIIPQCVAVFFQSIKDAYDIR